MNMLFRLPSVLAIAVLLLNVNAFSVRADDDCPTCHKPTPPSDDCHCHAPPEEHHCPCPTPTPPPCPEEKQAHFNIQCLFTDHDHDHDHDAKHKKCRVNSEFEKMVTKDGGEVADDSAYPFNPTFEIECDDVWIQKDHARRFTEILGTRIQALAGPFPALVLPRGELHEGPHSSEARLEFDDSTLHGSCFIYTGQPLMNL